MPYTDDIQYTTNTGIFQTMDKDTLVLNWHKYNATIAATRNTQLAEQLKYGRFLCQNEINRRDINLLLTPKP